MTRLRGIILSLLFFILLCSGASALEIAVINNNKALSGILVEIEDSYETHQYITDRDGKFSANLTEGYYWITIDVVENEGDTDEITYTYANEVYLVADELNIIECKMEETPGFGILVFIGAIALFVLIFRKRKK